MSILKSMNQEQLPRNLAGNIAYFFVNFIIGLLLVPYFISTLGVAAYGIIPLATSISGYVGLLTDSLNSTVSRYLTVDLQREDYKTANITFNTAFFSISGIILLLVPIVILISVYAPIFLSIPSGQSIGAIFLFLGIGSAFLIRSWSANFTVSLFAFNRLDLLNLINIVNILVQVSLIVIFFNVKAPSLALVGIAYLIGGIIASILAIILSKWINPYLIINIHDFDRSRLNDLTEMGWWVIVNQVGSYLFLSIDLVVVNIVLGASQSGEYAIALQWVILLRAIAVTLASVLTPIVLTFYARNQTESLIKVSKSAVKLMGLAMALPIGFICGFAPSLLTLWIGLEYSFLSPLIVVLTIHLAINLAILPLFSINIAYNRVKIPGIVTLFMGIGNLLLAVILCLYTGLGYYGVAIASAIVLTLKNALFTPWYATRILGVSIHTFTSVMVPGFIASLVIAGSAVLISMVFQLSNLFSLIVMGVIFSLIYLIILWLLCLDGFERGLFSSYLPIRIRRYVK